MSVFLQRRSRHVYGLAYNTGSLKPLLHPPKYHIIKALSSTANVNACETLTLLNGRVVSFARYGAPQGHPIIHLHGLPGSRLEGSVFAQEATDLGAQLITPDRPGIGLSAVQPRRRVVDYAEDILHLVKQLGIGVYSIMGVSGGGPYALACARFHKPQRLRGVALVAGIGPYEPFASREMKLANRLLFLAFRSAPWLVKPLISLSASLQLRATDDHILRTALKQLERRRLKYAHLRDKDREVLLEHPQALETFIRSSREHFRHGVNAFMEEGRLLTSDVGFDLDEVPAEQRMRLWYGRQDGNVPSAVGLGLAKNLGKRAELFEEDETHLSLVINCRRRILEDLLRAA